MNLHQKILRARKLYKLFNTLGIDKIKNELGWAPTVSFRTGLKKTIDWYVENSEWWQDILEKGYQADRIGLRK